MRYKQMAIDYYANHKDFKKALAAGIAMDNALTKDYNQVAALTLIL